jgi:putative two-component system response regulator
MNTLHLENEGVPDASSVRPRLLVVDDEEAVAYVLKRSLTRAGYEIEYAASGEEALQKLALSRFDGMLTDVSMPRMRGDELQRLARAVDPDMAVLMITAVSDVSLAVACLQGGVCDYITKPFDLEDINVRVAKALERRHITLNSRQYRYDLERQVARQSARIRRLHLVSLQSLNHALEAKDEGTLDHSNRVCALSHCLAVRLDMDNRVPDGCRKVALAALLHDIGKIGVPEHILNKPGKLTDEEMNDVKRHPELGEMILKPLLSLELLAIVRHHHERWDGAGYPDGISGEAIPFGARIVAVADSYDAMTCVRPYRAGMPAEKALSILADGAGTQWDPGIVAVFLEIAKSGPIEETIAEHSIYAQSNLAGYEQVSSLFASDEPGQTLPQPAKAA